MEVREPPATYTAYAALPTDAPRYEIVGGVGHLAPAPDSRHQTVVVNLVYLFKRHLEMHGTGCIYAAPCDVILSEHDVVQPDLFYVTGERKHMVRTRGIFGPPDLCVEVLSPATRCTDQDNKLRLYAAYGVREYWLVEPDGRMVDRWISSKECLDEHRMYAGTDAVVSSVLPGFAPNLTEIFAGLDEIRM